MNPARWMLALTLCCVPPVLAGPFDVVRGVWTGAVQFNAQNAPDAHSVGRFALIVGGDGTVEGEHTNGCKFSGLIKPYIGTTSFSLDVTMKGCKFAAFNRRWPGTFSIRGDKSGSFRLGATVVESGSRVVQYDAAGTLTK